MEKFDVPKIETYHPINLDSLYFKVTSLLEDIKEFATMENYLDKTSNHIKKRNHPISYEPDIS